MDGYQSDINLASQRFISSMPADHLVGGFGLTEGTNSYTLQLIPAIKDYAEGMVIAFLVGETNTGEATINVNGLGNLSILKLNTEGVAVLEPGDLVSGGIYLAVLNGEYVQLIGRCCVSGGGTVGPATEEQAGIAMIATDNELSQGEEDTKIVTAKKLVNLLINTYRASSEAVTGLLRIATIEDVNEGSDDTKAVSPLKLKAHLETRLISAEENAPGIAPIATQAQVAAGTDDSSMVTPLKLMTLINSRFQAIRSQVRFSSVSLPPDTVTTAVNDVQSGLINITGIPFGVTLFQATLSWEGVIQNLSASVNNFTSGQIALKNAAGDYQNVMPVISVGLTLQGFQAIFTRFFVADVTLIANTNGPFMAKFSQVADVGNNLSIQGRWILELDYESNSN